MNNYYLQNEPAIRARLAQLPSGPVYVNTYAESYRSNFIIDRPLSTPNVSEGLAGELNSWWYGEPVFIDAPTGTGKSRFVIQSLVRHVVESGQNGQVLIVYNRLALGNQYKELVLNEYNPELRKRFTHLGLQEINSFDSIPVSFCTYQGLTALIRQGVSQYTHVIFDEIHYVCSDALFARDTWWLLQQLPHAFKKAVRVYMTATPWAAQNLVAEAERGYELPLEDRMRRMDCIPYLYPNGSIFYDPRLKVYKFPSPFRNYRLHSLPSTVREIGGHETLVKLIKGSPTDQKWVVFIHSKKSGQKLAKSLNGIAAYLDAEHKSGPVWEELAAKERFSTQVLVTTAVTDCGVNINDPAVKHVVLFSTDHVQFMQELGRKRLKEGETLHVYVPDLSPQQWRQLNAKNERLIQLVDDVSQHPEGHCTQRFNLWYDGDREARCLVPIEDKGNLQINLCAEQVIRQRALSYQELEDQWTSGEKHPFLRIVARWLELPESALTNALEGGSEAAFCHFLDENCGQPLESKVDQNKFSNKFRELYTTVFGPRETGSRRKDPWGHKIISGLLLERKLPYALVITKDTWQLTKIGEETINNV